LSALSESLETLIYLRLAAYLEKTALLEAVDGKPVSVVVSTQLFFSSESFLLWINSSVAVQGFEN